MTRKLRCPVCKYDLSGCTTGVRLNCPECGFKSTVGWLEEHLENRRGVMLAMIAATTLQLLVILPMIAFFLIFTIGMGEFEQ